ncbi:iron-sulfur cluster assembly scaffold protein [Candidatus Woesearchaeota archaeon]|nr:iron-sulfur cluster assembly scaffold protein [Candidatus Woesearchaeota archaeon]
MEGEIEIQIEEAGLSSSTSEHGTLGQGVGNTLVGNTHEEKAHQGTSDHNATAGDVSASNKSWFYTDIVKEHFFNPRNLFKTKEEADTYFSDGMGFVGSPACGDMMKIWIQVKDDRIKECKWQTFGCASAIASTSMMSVMITENEGMVLEEAMHLKPQDIVKRLGDLPARKFHCSVLGDKALRAAINDYYAKHGHQEKVIEEKHRMIDHIAKVTDHDIEEAVLEGATTFEAVQKKTKVGVANKQCIPEVEQLIKFYKEKYYGSE